MSLERDIRNTNPWWADKSSICRDRKVVDWEESVAKYMPQLKHMITYIFEPSNTVVYSLRGPRQVGKTTLVKLQIKEFLDVGTNPWNILYYPLDLAGAAQDLVDVMETYMELSAGLRKEKERGYYFLDEISSVPSWQKGIKWLVDNDRIKNCTIMATGSHSVDIRKAAERLPGRRGNISDDYDKILLPMKFSEYVSVRNKMLKNEIEEHFLPLKDRKDIFKKLLDGEIDDRIHRVHVYKNQLDVLLREYMITGGIPKIVNEKMSTGHINENSYRTYLDGITGEWNTFGQNVPKLKQFCRAVTKSLSGHTSWNSLSKEADIGSSDTVSNYANTLKDMFIMSIIHRYGEDKKVPMLKSDKKIYYHDPYFLHIFNSMADAADTFEASLDFVDNEKNQGSIIEGIVADHLIRWAFTLSSKKQTFDYYNHVFYWKDEKNREVDFVLSGVDGMEVPIEVKYRKKINFKELSGLVSFLNKSNARRGLVVSKSTLMAKSDYVIVPASVFLLLV